MSMRESKLGIGFIGCGQIGVNKHMPALAELNDKAQMVAFCDMSREVAANAAKTFGVKDAKVYTDYHELLNDARVDVVHVLVPNAYHAGIVVDAFAQKKHVMCEKPMAINSAEAERMIDAWRKSGKKFTVAYQNRFRDEVKTLYKARKELGEIYYAEAYAIRRRGIPTWGVFTDKTKQGGGPLIDIGTHALDLALYLMDNWEPEMVMGQTFCKIARTLKGDDQGVEKEWDADSFNTEDSAFGMIRMKNGAVIYLKSSWALNTLDVREAAVQLCGTKGGAELKANGIPGSADLVFNTTKYGKQLEIHPNITKQKSTDGRRHAASGLEEQKAWIDAIINDTDPVVKPEEALTVTKILDAIYSSAETGKAVFFK